MAFAVTLNGWMLNWGIRTWVPFTIAGAWLGWSWWGLLIASRPRYGIWRFLPAGLFLYLLFTAAHPHVDLMIAVVTAWLVLGQFFAWRRLRTIWRLAASGAHSLALRAVLGRTIFARLWPIGAAGPSGCRWPRPPSSC